MVNHLVGHQLRLLAGKVAHCVFIKLADSQWPLRFACGFLQVWCGVLLRLPAVRPDSAFT